MSFQTARRNRRLPEALPLLSTAPKSSARARVRGECCAPVTHPALGDVLPAFLVAELEQHLTTRPPESDAFVFVSPEGGTLNHKNFYRRHFKPAIAAAGLPPQTRFHDLRHTCAALCIALGAHPKAIQERLGHSSITVTLDRYGHLFPKLDETLTARLGDLHRAAGPVR